VSKIMRGVMPGHSASEDARNRAYDPGIHPLRQVHFAKEMDRRAKPGDDGANN